VRPEVQKLVRFEQANLLGGSIVEKNFEAIFCRNVGIDFYTETRTRSLRKLAAMQRAGDLLMLGHAETAGTDNGYYELIEQSAYVRTAEDVS
jgi:chemotaxis protein methyltransferase CheR